MLEELLTLIVIVCFLVILFTIALALFCNALKRLSGIDNHEKKTIEPIYTDIVDGREKTVQMDKKTITSPVIYIHDD